MCLWLDMHICWIFLFVYRWKRSFFGSGFLHDWSVNQTVKNITRIPTSGWRQCAHFTIHSVGISIFPTITIRLRMSFLVSYGLSPRIFPRFMPYRFVYHPVLLFLLSLSFPPSPPSPLFLHSAQYWTLPFLLLSL